ncbi:MULTISPECIES: hypothetical protein [Leptospira]|uniref:DUF1931 domain-containing protein n=25 Tax=Leptospira TaxID=171 RepID=Q8F3E8_LEPIN|nr:MULTISPECIES: hypothetical protein [Leptospira]APH41383.1 Uncharacterized protein A9P81_1599 [Leptospira interrogans serovar Copenhageni/Icterohaemorrhagiae]EMF41867.1 hypothetical protein LEP1GSC067_1019 [Leptospira interrogans serovar Lora str. TE 1992]EMF73819.1 hypothetical protein LEP1GSC148_1134 [Leptospira interrogans serovar Canicola str. LT1962]EMG10332.1 hypothetical protein LEP1GSC151_2882 [Leptospira interrogans serovar Grippotyphosa str. LT2186]EMG20314.1 hypothetical protein L
MAGKNVERETLIVTSKVKAYIKSKGFMTSGDAIDGLNEKIHQLIDDAVKRTESNKRSTVRPTDF